MLDAAQNLFIVRCKDCDTEFYSRSTFVHHQGVCEKKIQRIELEMLQADTEERRSMLLAMPAPLMVRMHSSMSDNMWGTLLKTMSEEERASIFAKITLQTTAVQVGRWRDHSADSEWVSGSVGE